MALDYYKILDVPKNASDAEIKAQYRKLARKYHPDVSKLKNAEKRFKEINEAYEVLKNKEKRRQYDMFGHAGAGAGFNPGGGFNSGGFNSGQGENSGFDGFGQGGFGNFSDIFENMFKNQSQSRPGFNSSQRTQQTQQQNRAASSQTLDIHVPLEDVFLGAEKIFNLSFPGESTPKKIKVKIPKGIIAGKKIRLPHQGKNNNDILLKINYHKHDLFEVKDNDILLNLPITIWEAAMGATISVPTLGGKVDLKIPPDSQSGRKLRLKGQGLGSPAGDLYVTLMIKIPPSTNNELAKLYTQIKHSAPYDPREHFRRK
ncbi:MAG: DnaJ domain-containing protein [Gammaproteobacteria bacterium]|nr:DnaJ domain-containing protein [Gammaproteobacteria bacterium]